MQNKPHANYCGAKTRSGQPCKNRAMLNGRCRMHGGKSTGAPPEKMKGNQNSKKHGFFSKYIPQETLEIMGMLDEKSPADLIWDQIMIQYAAIIRAQQLMYVEEKDEIVKVLKKEKETDFATEREWEFQFAWDRHATFLNAQSRAMSELRSLIKQFNDLAHEDDERRLKLEAMQLGIEKRKVELSHMRGDMEGNAHEQADSYVEALNSQVDYVFADEDEVVEDEEA